MAVKLGKRQNYFNIFVNMLAFVIQFAINFYISPVIVEKVGASAYGFLGLANDFVSYVAIIATVFNSVAARFITKAFYEKDYEKANHYFNSLIVTNLVISIFLSLICGLLIPNINRFLSVPSNILVDVKISFFLVFGAYIVSLVTLVFTTSTFVTNRTDIQGGRNIIQYIIRFTLIVFLLNCVSVHIYWVAFAMLISTIIVSILNVGLTKRLTPELRIRLGDSNKRYVLELAKSGSWMALTSISIILLRGLDLIIANIFIGDYEMGLLSVARTIPNNVTAVISTLAPIFTPTFIAHYVAKKNKDLIESMGSSIKILAVILFVPVTCFIIYSHDFFSLWQNSLTKHELSLVSALAILTVIQAYFNSTTASLAQVSVVVNKLKMPVFVSFLCGIISIAAEIVMIKIFNMGLYSIVISTTVVMISRHVFFNPMYAAWCLRKPLLSFIPMVCKTWAIIPVLFCTTFVVKMLVSPSSWVNFIISLLLSLLIGYLIIIAVSGRATIKSIAEKLKKSR